MTEAQKQKVKERVAEAKEKKLTTLDLRNCGLGEIPEEVFELTHLEHLLLGAEEKKEQGQTVYFHSNYISELPHKTVGLASLKSLDLSSNALWIFPEEITTLSNLTTLDLSFNKLSQLPDSITKLNNLTTLYLMNTNLSQLPDSITKLNNLTTLDLKNNKLSQLPDSITKLNNLTTLSLSFNNLSQLPDSITKLNNLTTLSLSFNNLSQLPDSITKLNNLTTLDLSFNNLSQLPDSITKLNNLTTLSLSDNNLSQLPDSITKLNNLTTLSLSHNKLSQLLDPITKLNNLTTLDLKNNKLSQLPDSITKLNNLTTLYLMNTNLSQLPDSITKLNNLTTLDLKNNKLSQLPDSITKLNNLTTLDLKNNKLSQLPDSITKLNNLTTLYLMNTNLSQLPDSITKLNNLTTLDLKNNKLSQLPAKIVRLRKLKILSLYKAPITTPPPEIVNRGIPAIFNYFEELEEATDCIYEAKLLIVGEGRVGKTSLMKSLTDAEYQLEDESTTEGINVQTWIIPKEKTGFGKDFLLNVWDFGGQEIYHATHQFFLSKRSVYLLVTEPRKEVPHDDFYYWLNIIKLLGDKSPVLLVQNKADQPLEDIPVKEYKSRFDNIAGNLQRTSCKPNRKNTILDLQDVIANIVKNPDLLPHVGTELPKAWADVREELSVLQKKDKPQIDYKVYLEVCQKYEMDAERAGFLADFFHDLGVFLHFKDNLKLRKVVFLNNEWVTHGVYKVLDDEKVIKNNGEFSHADLDRLWQDTEYDGWEDAFIELMQEFKICYPLRGKKKSYLAPHRLPKDEPENLPWKDANNLHFEYHYEFMPKGMLTRFIVERYKDICERFQWRYGVLLDFNNTFALVKEDHFKRKIIIRLEGQDKVYVLRQIRDTFKEIHNDFTNLALKEMVPCNCSVCKTSNEPNFYPHNSLNRYIESGIKQVLCDTSLKQVSVQSLLDGIDPEFKGTHDEPINLTGKQFKQLTEALTSAFPNRNSLAQMLRFGLEKPLNNISQGSNLSEIAFEVMETAEAEGWVKDLILAAREHNSGSPELRAIAEELGVPT